MFLEIPTDPAEALAMMQADPAIDNWLLRKEEHLLIAVRSDDGAIHCFAALITSEAHAAAARSAEGEDGHGT